MAPDAVLSRLSRRTKRRAGGTVVGGTGVVLAAIHGVHLLAEIPETPAAALTGAAWPFALGVGLVAAGWWTARRERSGDLALRTAGWCLGGVAMFLIGGSLVVVYQHVEGTAVSHAGYVIANAGTLGAVLGFVVGRYDARTVRRTRELDALFSNLPFPAARYEVADDRAFVRHVNPAFAETFGCDPGAAVDRPVEELVAPPGDGDEVPTLDQELPADGPFSRIVRRRTVTGIREFALHVIPYDVGDPTPTGFAVGVDVTERRQQLRRLQVLNRVLRHDLRNAANVIAGYADLLADDPEKVDERAAIIRENATEMVELGERVRALESTLGGHEGATVALDDVLRSEVAALRRDYPAAVIRLDADVADAAATVNPLVDVALGNVLENAVEHNDADEPRVDVTLAADGGHLLVRVADDGPGIPPRELEALQRRRETPLSHTSGLGIWVSRWIVEDTGGDLSVDERSPRGTVVTVWLPRAHAGPGASDAGADDAEAGDVGADEAREGEAGAGDAGASTAAETTDGGSEPGE